jgi:hypothetical protein
MKITIHKEKLMSTMEDIEVFEIHTRKGYAYGFLHGDILKIHHIGTNDGMEHPIKGIMDILCKRFKTKKFIFQMVINPELQNRVNGQVVKIPADAEGNPFGEELTEIHGTWGDFHSTETHNRN